MTPTLNQTAIVADGEYSLYQEQPTRKVLLEWCITAGTATVTPGYVNLAGTFSPHRGLDGVLPVFGAEGGICGLDIPNSGLAALKVEEAAGGFSMIVCQSRVIP